MQAHPVPPNDVISIAGYNYLIYETDERTVATFRLIIASNIGEIVHDIPGITRIYISQYTNTCTITSKDVPYYKFKIPPYCQVIVLADKKK